MQLELQNAGYSYNGRELVLHHVNYRFEGGRIYAITGRFRAGKAALLSLFSQLTRPAEEKILYDGLDVNEVGQYLYRNQYAGVVFQNFDLLMHLTAVENVMLSMDIAGVKKKNNRIYAMELSEKIRLSKEKSQRRTLKLSNGQQQRVAIAHAVLYDPSILLAGKSTGNPDEDTQDEIMEIFKGLAYEEQKCIILVTHSPVAASLADEVYALTDTKKAKNRQKGV